MASTDVWTIAKVLSWTRGYLAEKGVTNARREADWLLCAATGTERIRLYLDFDKPLNSDELKRLRELVSRRGRREPLQHILGSQEFCGLEFEVSRDVLIPRHETELLVKEAVSLVPEATAVLDVGTGSGCIAISLAGFLPKASITAVDISAAALDVARRNARRHQVRIEFLHGSLCEPVAGRRFDLIVSNPPYISRNDIDCLEPEVRDYDPREALDGGPDGLDIIRTLISDASGIIHDGGWLLLEVGAGQSAVVRQLITSTGVFSEPVAVCDSLGIERVVGARRTAP